MFTDPTSITINSVAKSFARISSNQMSSTYRTADGTFVLTITHTETKSKRFRTEVRLVQTAIVADPITSENDEEQLTFYCVVDRPRVGFSDAQIDQLIQGLKGFLTTANNSKLYALES